MKRFIPALPALAVLLSGCASTESNVEVARATLLNSHGDEIGRAEFVETTAGTEFQLTAAYLPPGMHAVHIHEGNLCAPPAFETAEEHFNPTGNAHGFDATGGPHAGDLRNFEVAEDGTVDLERTLSRIDPRVGSDSIPDSIIDKTVVIHAEPDDYVSQPAGKAGERIACGVIQAIPETLVTD
jgi:Cu-Zn family superoxide dismutase